jgi:pimeloyl-ACP methyl ester carboxylesterase
MPPAQPEQHQTQVAGLNLYALRAGRGPAVVLLHHSFGNPGWTALHAELAIDRAVYAPDLPGFGRSQRPDWARHPRDLALLTGAWLARLGADRVHLVGMGFGGWVAAELATMRPERLASLALVGAAGLLPREGRILDQILMSHSEYVRAAFSRPEAYEAVYGATLDVALLEQWDINREMTTRVAWKPYMYSRQLPPLLSEVQLPALIVWGERDQVVPPCCAEQYARALPHARLEIMPGAGHALDLEQPAALAKLIREHTAHQPPRGEEIPCS